MRLPSHPRSPVLGHRTPSLATPGPLPVLSFLCHTPWRTPPRIFLRGMCDTRTHVVVAGSADPPPPPPGTAQGGGLGWLGRPPLTRRRTLARQPALLCVLYLLFVVYILYSTMYFVLSVCVCVCVYSLIHIYSTALFNSTLLN